MVISDIYIKNFRGYGEDLNQSDGFYKFNNLDKPDIILITGHNGYGKTTIYEAIEWCLTNDIKSLRRQTEYVNQKNTLKKSQYLKFQSTYDDREREVFVGLKFDNEITIFRTTKCNTLHEDNYQSKLTDGFSRVITEEYVIEFIKEKSLQPLDKFFRLSFCGQAYTEDLIRDTNAKNRGGILMSFLGMDILNEIILNSDTKKNLDLNTNFNNTDIAISSCEEAKNKLNGLFSVNGWGNIEIYLNVVKEKIGNVNQALINLHKDKIIDEIKLSGDTVEELEESFNVIKILTEKFKNVNDLDNKVISSCIKERLIYEEKSNFKFIKDIELIEKIDIDKLNEEYESIISKEIIHEEAINNINIKISIYKNKMIQMNRIDNPTLSLTVKHLDDYIEKLQLYNTILQEMKVNKLPYEKKNFDLNLYRLKGFSMVYKYLINRYKTILTKKNDALKEIQGMHDNMKNILLQVQSYIISSDSIDKCPVCNGKDFYKEGGKAKLELLKILGESIADGDQRLIDYNESIVAIEAKINRLQNRHHQVIIETYKKYQQTLYNELTKCIDILMEHYDTIINCNTKRLNHIILQKENIERRIKICEVVIEKYGIDITVLNEKKEKLKEQNQFYEQLLQIKFDISPDEIITLSGRRNHNIRKLIKHIHLRNKVLILVNELLDYDIGSENLNLLKNYEKYIKMMNDLEYKKLLYGQAIKFRENVNKVTKSIQTEMIKQYIEKNELINLIYKYINPHPFFRDIIIEKKGTETNFISSVNNQIYLDHLFSEAQMKVLSLSVFLGLNLSVKNNNFNQVYIDDPVQSMDDINMISFIDLLRNLKTSKKVSKNFIIGTHDNNFSKLVKIKFRNLTFIEYKIDSYSLEGPKIITYNNFNIN
jgi:DNA repair exonuclease SbcCD ATPase subunit